MKKTLTIYFFISSSLLLVSCGDSFFKSIKNNKIKTVEEVKELINQGANIHYKDRGGNSLLHVVGNVELATFFLEQGLDKEAKNNKGETPLYTTIKRGHYDVALFLKKKWADCFAETKNEIKYPHNLVFQHLREENLSPEEKKILKEIARLSIKHLGTPN